MVETTEAYPELSEWETARWCFIALFGGISVVLGVTAAKKRIDSKGRKMQDAEKVAWLAFVSCLFNMLFWIGYGGARLDDWSEEKYRNNLLLSCIGYTAGVILNMLAATVWLQFIQEICFAQAWGLQESTVQKVIPTGPSNASKVLVRFAVFVLLGMLIVSFVCRFATDDRVWTFQVFLKILYAMLLIEILVMWYVNFKFASKASGVLNEVSHRGRTDEAYQSKMATLKFKVKSLYRLVNAACVTVGCIALVLCATNLIYNPIAYEVVIFYFSSVQWLFDAMLLYVVKVQKTKSWRRSSVTPNGVASSPRSPTAPTRQTTGDLDSIVKTVPHSRHPETFNDA